MKTIDYFNDASDKSYKQWSSSNPMTLLYEYWYQDIVKELRLKKEDAILEIGCGTGGFPSLLMLKNAKYYGIDFSAESVKIAKTMNNNNSSYLHFLVSDVQKLPFKNDVFNKFVCVDTLYYIPNLEQALKEINRVLSVDSIGVKFQFYPGYLSGLIRKIAHRDQRQFWLITDPNKTKELIVHEGFTILKEPIREYIAFPIFARIFRDRLAKIPFEQSIAYHILNLNRFLDKYNVIPKMFAWKILWTVKKRGCLNGRMG